MALQRHCGVMRDEHEPGEQGGELSQGYGFIEEIEMGPGGQRGVSGVGGVQAGS